MKLRTAKYLLYVFCLLMVVSLLICFVTKVEWIGYLGIAFAFLGVLFWVIFGRCPHCGAFLGRSWGNIVLIVGKRLIGKFKFIGIKERTARPYEA